MAKRFSNTTVDSHTKELATLAASVPLDFQFQRSWLHPESTTPPWPIDAQAASLHEQIHNCIVYLQNQSIDDSFPGPLRQKRKAAKLEGVVPKSRPSEVCLKSCREILRVFQYLSRRQREGWLNWSTCRRACQAASMLSKAEPKFKHSEDQSLLLENYQGFQEVHKLGIYRLGRVATESPGASLIGTCDDSGMVTHEGYNEHIAGLEPNKLYNVSDPAKSDILCAVAEKAPNMKAGRCSDRITAFPDLAAGKRPCSLASESSRNTATTDRAKVYHANSPKVLPSIGQESPTFDLSGCRPSNAVASPTSILHNSLSSSPQELPNLQNDPRASNTVTLSETSGTNHSLPTPISLADGSVINQLFTSRQAPFTQGPEAQTFVLSNDPITQQNIASYPSHPPSLSGYSYPSSTYANSVASALQTPSASHPVSPMLNHGILLTSSDTHTIPCGNQSAAQPQTPSWQFDSTISESDAACLMTGSSIIGLQDGMRLAWPSSTFW